MKRYTFILEEYEETGSIGWRPEWFPGADPLAGIAVAHDILEHDNMTKGDVNEEVEALGRMHWIRGEGGYFHNQKHYHPPAEAFAADMCFILDRHLTREEHENKGWVDITKEDVPIDPERDCYEDLLGEAVSELLKEARERFTDADDYYAGWQKCVTKDHLEQVRRSLRKGFYDAMDRYSDPYEVAHLFSTIEKGADKLLRRFEEHEVGEVKLHVDVDFERFHAEFYIERLEDPDLEDELD